MPERYHVIRDDRGRWGFSADGVTFGPGSGAYRTASEALDTLRALLRGRGLAPGPARADAAGLVVEVARAAATVLVVEVARETRGAEADPDVRD